MLVKNSKPVANTTRQTIRSTPLKVAVLGLFLCVGAAVLALSLNKSPKVPLDNCQTVISEGAQLGRSQLPIIKNVQKDSEFKALIEKIGQPYCQLPDATADKVGTFQRYAYPLSFQPNTWLVIGVSNGRVIAFGFSA